MSVIAHNIIAIILICVSKGRGRARGPVVPCVVGYPSPPRPCGSLCVFHVLWVIAPAPPPFAKARSLVGGRGHTVGNVDSYVDDVCLFVECGRGGGGHTMGGGLRRGDAAPCMEPWAPVRKSAGAQTVRIPKSRNPEPIKGQILPRPEWKTCNVDHWLLKNRPLQ